MKAIINNIEYNNVRWWIDSGIGMLEIISDASIVDIVNAIGTNTQLYMYQTDADVNPYPDEYENEHPIDDELIAIWHINGIERIYTVLDDGVRHIVIGFHVNLITDNAEKLIHNDIDISLDSIIELAEVIADTENATKIQAQSIEQLQTTVEQYNTRIAQLESLINAIPNYILTRFDALTVRDNTFAERIANLENHLN